MVTANGSAYAAGSFEAFSIMGISIDDPTDYIIESEIQNPLNFDTQSFNIEYLLTNIDSGSHIIRLLAYEAFGDTSYNLWQPRLIVQVLGYACTNSLNFLNEESDQVAEIDITLDPAQFISPAETGSGR